MDAAGLVSYVYATAALLGGREALDAARRSPVARKGVRLFHGPWGWNFGNYYFVYALERVGTVLALPLEDWYLEGARILVRNQHADGSWRAMSRQGDDQHAYETALALLFLSRATARSITPGGQPRKKGGEHRNRVGLPDPSIPGNLERAFSYYLALGEKGRKEAAADFGPAGTPALALLILKLRDEREPVRAAAFDLLDRLVAKRFLFQADWPRTDREWMLSPIEAFWRAHRDDLIWDARRKLFVSR